jgi:hypothetical protein
MKCCALCRRATYLILYAIMRMDISFYEEKWLDLYNKINQYDKN